LTKGKRTGEGEADWDEDLFDFLTYKRRKKVSAGDQKGKKTGNQITIRDARLQISKMREKSNKRYHHQVPKWEGENRVGILWGTLGNWQDCAGKWNV